MYRSIETFSKKRPFTAFMHRIFFKPVASILLKKRHSRLLQLQYRNFEGKIIRNIGIVTLDPFGYSVDDTAITPQKVFPKIGNGLHIRTRYMTIRNILLIRKNKPFDSLLVKESMRLVRRQNYVREVAFHVVSVKGATDSVDIYIRVSDRWTIIPNGAGSNTRVTVRLTENNLIGFGHEFQNACTWNRSTGRYAFAANYLIPNIRNSYISASVRYRIDNFENSATSLAIERPFYSPLARWAAGVSIAELIQKDPPGDTVSGHVRQAVRSIIQDYWAGSAHRMLRGNTEGARTTNAFIAARYLRLRYLERPSRTHDSLHTYSNEDFYVLGIGISTRKYFQDNYIFRFGAVEDVPVGKVFGITGGYQVRNDVDRSYVGARISFGEYFEWGYLSSTFEYGTFIHRLFLEQGVLAASTRYFSPLLKIGKWRLRQFIKPQVTWGMNRLAHDSLTINNDYGIRGFAGTVSGTKKIVLTLQTQSYAPRNVGGFRFGPFLSCSFGMLGNATSEFANSRVYSQLGIGVLINNEHLILSNFQVSLAYYPSMPGRGDNIVKPNAFRTTDFGLRDFDFGKPGTVVFQ